MFNRRLLAYQVLVYQGGRRHLNPRCQQMKLYCGRVALKMILLSLSRQV